MVDGKKELVEEVRTLRTKLAEFERIEVEGKQTEKINKTLIEYSPTTVYIFDDQMRFVGTNPAGEKLLGYSRDELLTMSIPQVDAEPEIVKPAHRQLNRCKPLLNYEHKLRRKDGHIITVLNNSVPMKDSNGKITNWYSFLMDITERKLAEQNLS
jgi:PAS domain S-box-containing protein